MSNQENFSDLNSNARYYANPIEQQILIQGLQRYFSLPERSQNRNKIAKDVSTFLKRFSPHWSHRAVRLWFNNNKHTYFGSNDAMQGMNANTAQPQMPNPNPNMNTGIPAPIPIVGTNMPNPPPAPQIFPQAQPINPVSPFVIPIQQSILSKPLNPAIPVPKVNQLPIPIQSQAPPKTPPPPPQQQQKQQPKPQIENKSIPPITEKINIPSPQILNPDLLQPRNPPQPPPQINNSNRNTPYPIINSPTFHPPPIPTPNISNVPKNNQNNFENQEPKPSLPNAPQTLPAPQIVSKINSPKTSRSPIQVSSPVQVVSPRQTPEKIPLTLPPIKVSDISPSIQSNKRTNAITINNLTNNSSRNISSSPSIEGKNIVSSPITSQKYIMRPPIQIGSKILFPPIQVEDDFSVSNLNNFNSSSISSFPTSSSFSMEPTIDQSYASLSRLLNDIQEAEECDPQLDQKIIEYDNRINALKSRCYNIDIDRIEPRLKSTRFPFSREPSTEFNLWNQIPESNSNLDILSEFPMRSPSFSHQFFYATDNASASHVDSFAIWQARNFEDKKVPYFECSAFGGDFAAYAHLQLQNQNQRVLSFYNYRSSNSGRQRNYGNESSSILNSMTSISALTNNANNPNDDDVYGNKQWENIVIDCNSRVEAMTIDAPYAWLLADGIVTHASFDQNLESGQVNIPSQYSYIDSYKDGCAVASSSSSGNLIMISDSLETLQIHTSYRGMTSVHSLNETMIVGVSLSCIPRQINTNGNEIRAFVGHCANVQGIAILSPTTFASRADDYTVRIWDIRKREPVMTVTTLHNSVINIAGSANFVVTAFHNKIGVIDIRGSSGKPILGVSTEDYDAASLNYNQQDDCLAMFGVIEKENNKDSMLFVGGDGQSRQRIFRMYHNFVGIQNE